jgi:hypothetical protein
MKTCHTLLVIAMWLVAAVPLFAQNVVNCFKVDIVDLMGRIVYSRVVIPADAILHLQPRLASGAYFVRLHNIK